MLSFALVVAKPGCSVPPDVETLLKRSDLADLPFVPDYHLHWSDDSGSVHFAGWQGFTDVLEVGSHWDIEQQGLVAFSGRPLLHGRGWKPGRSWASQLRDLWAKTPIVSDDEPLTGIYAGLSIDRSGRGALITDPLSVAVLYRAQTADVTVIANNARLAATIAAGAHTPPPRDRIGAAWLIHFGYMPGEVTTFTGTTAVPQGSYVEVDPRFGCRLVDRTGSPWSAPQRSGLSFDEYMDLLHDDLRSNIQSVADLSTPELLADLTGGRDSRMVLALIVEQGLQDRFLFRTTGDAHTPDSQVSERLAGNLHLAHLPMRPTPMDGSDFQNRLRTHVFQTSGLLNPWDFKGALSVSTKPRVSGLFGELLRNPPPHVKQVGHTDEELWSALRRGMQLDKPSILHADLQHEFDTTLKSLMFESSCSGGTSNQDRLDSFYIRNRIRRWVGAQEELGEAGRLFPLYSIIGVQVAFAIGSDARSTEVIPFEVMRRSHSALTREPFADEGWKKELLDQMPDSSRYAVPPVKRSSSRTAPPVQWQRSRIDDNQDVVREYLLDERSSPLFDLVDRAKVEAILDGDPGQTSRPYQQLFAAMSAAIWLGGDELPARYGDGSYEPAHSLGRVAPDPSRPHDEQGAESATAPRAVPAQPETALKPPTAKRSKAITAPNLPGPMADFGRRLRLTTARRLRDAAKRVAP